MNVDYVIDKIKTDYFVIYGNGYIAKRFYKILIKMGISENLYDVAVTEIKKDMIGVNGKKVKRISDIKRNYLVIIAVHNIDAEVMKDNLERLGFKSYIWIYPYLFDLELGRPVRRDCAIDTITLLRGTTKSYTPVIYYLTVNDYCNEKKYGGEVYIKLMNQYCEKETAKKRWLIFRKKIEQCQIDGFVQNDNVKVLESYNIIDGLHRLILAIFFREKYLRADVYGGIDEFYSKKGIGGDVLIDDKKLVKVYNNKEIYDIKKAAEELKNIMNGMTK